MFRLFRISLALSAVFCLLLAACQRSTPPAHPSKTGPAPTSPIPPVPPFSGAPTPAPSPVVPPAPPVSSQDVTFLVPAGQFPAWFQEKLRDNLKSPVVFVTYASLAEAREKWSQGTYDAVAIPDRLIPEMHSQLAPIAGWMPTPTPLILAMFLHHYFDRENQISLPYAWTLAAIALPNGPPSKAPKTWQEILNNTSATGVDDPAFRNTLARLRQAPANVKTPFLSPIAAPSPTGAPPETVIPPAVGPLSELLRQNNVENNKLILLPAEGSAIYLYHAAIPTAAQHPEASRAFLALLFDPEISARLAMENFLGPTELAAEKLLPPERLTHPLLSLPNSILDRCLFVKEGAGTPPTLAPIILPAATAPSASPSPAAIPPTPRPLPTPVPPAPPHRPSIFPHR